MKPDFLVIGHITCDVAADGSCRQGGTATYAALTAQRLGRTPAVLTRAAPDYVLDHSFRDIEVCRLPSAGTTTFRNIYTQNGRRQIVHTVAPALHGADVPAAWRRVPLVLLGSVAQEIDVSVTTVLADNLVGVVPQGWMRGWDADGHVFSIPWESAGLILPAVTALILSEEDLGGDRGLLQQFCSLCSLVVLTLGARGCQVWQRNQVVNVRPRPAAEVDPTGAGDVFAASFLIRLAEVGDPLVAARFANVAASMSVEGSGFSHIPTRTQVERALADLAHR